MKNITSKKKTQKIALIFLIVLLFNCFIQNYSIAARPSDRGTDTHSTSTVLTIDDEITAEDVSFDGGTLLTPIKKLGKGIGDSIMSLVQKIVVGNTYRYPIAYVKQVEDGKNDAWDDWRDATIGYPAYLFLTPESIFRNQIGTLNPNFITSINLDGTLEKALGSSDTVLDGDGRTHAQILESNLNTLRKTIARWYVAIRNFSLVGLLSVLVYIGIRIVISSTASDKAKYKQMISAWVSAICLIFLLHYIMAFTFMLTDKLTNMFNTNATKSAIALPTVDGEKGEFLFNNDDNNSTFSQMLDKLDGQSIVNKSAILNGDTIIGVANLMQYARLYANLNGASGLGYAAVYLFLVAFTVVFFIKYMARLIRIAFLTLIAPLITLTYPIDKLNDGQAQAFNMWLKEFVFNVLIQPFHLLIYVVFVSSALDFANSNIIYTIVVLGFISQAEKILKKMFGFEKATTLGSFSGAAAGSMAANLISKASSKLSAGGKGGKNNGGNNSDGGNDSGQQDRIREGNSNPYEGLDSGESDEQRNQRGPIGQNQNNENNREYNVNNEHPDLEQERNNIETERQALESFLDEGTTPGTDWDEEDYEAYRELEAEQEERESRFREAEQRALEEDQQSEIREAQQPELEEQQDENGETQQVEQGEGEKPEENQVQEEGKMSNLKKLKGGITAVGGAGLRKLGNATGMHMIKGWKNMNHSERAKALGRNLWSGTKTMAPKALKAGTKYTLAGTAALVAGATALQSGDPKTILSSTGIAATAGAKIGGGLSTKAVSGVSKVSDTFMRGWRGNEYENKQKEKSNSEWYNNTETDNKYRAAFGSDKFKEAKDVALDMRNKYGTTNDDDIIKSLKMTEDFGGNKAIEEARKADIDVPDLDFAKRIPAFSKDIDDGIFDDYKKFTQQQAKMQKRFMNQGMRADQAKEATEKVLKATAKFKGKQIPVTENPVQANNIRTVFQGRNSRTTIQEIEDNSIPIERNLRNTEVARNTNNGNRKALKEGTLESKMQRNTEQTRTSENAKQRSIEQVRTPRNAKKRSTEQMRTPRNTTQSRTQKTENQETTSGNII